MYDKYLGTVYPHSEASPSVCVDNDIKWREPGKAPLITCSLIPTPQAPPKNLEKGVVTHVQISISPESAHCVTVTYFMCSLVTSRKYLWKIRLVR